jgi:RNA polymerase sigma factor (sigma-70 family)
MNKSYELYISEIKNSIVSSQEELRLAQIYKDRCSGWEDARDTVIKSNLLYVVKVAFEYSQDPIKVSDLISEGNMGLLDSLNRFDPSLGIKLITFANKEIRGRMVKFILKNNYFSAFKLSFKTRNEANKVKAFFEDCLSTTGEKPSVEAVKKKFQINTYDAEMYLCMADSKTISIDYVLEYEGKEEKIIVEDESVVRPDQELNNKQVSEIVLKIIARLPLRERTVINRRFGLNGEEAADLQTIGLQFDLTKERIRQIEVSAIKKIQSEMERLKVK